MTPVISIGCQIGGPEPCAIADLKVSLYQALAQHITSTHCPVIDEYAIILRVDGSLDKFGTEGIARLMFSKVRRYIKVEVQIPESVWRPMTDSQTKEYLVRQVKAAISACVARLRKDNCPINEQNLLAEIDTATKAFLANMVGA